MVILKKNIFLTGAPSSGKTTVIKKIISKLSREVNGFYTIEERINGKRSGFMMHTLDGKTAYLAHQDIESEISIRRYGISIENVEKIAVPSIKPTGENIIILDEIGKMECFAELFQKAVIKALDAPNIVLGTITYGGTDFILDVKKREDIEIIEVTRDNRDQLADFILEKISILHIAMKK